MDDEIIGQVFGCFQVDKVERHTFPSGHAATMCHGHCIHCGAPVARTLSELKRNPPKRCKNCPKWSRAEPPKVHPDRRVKTGKYKDWRTKMLKFNEASIENLSRASHDESNQDFNICCAYYPRTGELSYKFGPKDHPQANDVKAPDGMAVMLDIIYRPVDAPEIKSMIELACRRALERHPARKDLKGKL